MFSLHVDYNLSKIIYIPESVEYKAVVQSSETMSFE